MSFARYPEYKDSGVEWLGEVPGHWEVVRLNTTATCNDEVLLESTAEDYEIEYVEISGVQAGQGITETATLPFGNAPSRARRVVRDGDVLISTVRTYLRAIAQVKSPPENMIASTGFAVLRPRRIDSRFLGYACHAEGFVSEVIARSVGVSYPAINASELARLPIPLPTAPEQTAIATFLDRETAKIDALVAEQEKLIALLQEKRQAVISHAVTKGLDPNVPMKDSGVEWLGEVPGHWEVRQLKHLARLTTGMTPPTDEHENYEENGFPWVRPEDIDESGAITKASKFLSEKGKALARLIPAGASLICCIGTIGKVGIVDENVSTNQQITAATFLGDHRYFYFTTCAARVELENSATGNVLKILNTERLGETKYPSPPLTEQTTIAIYLDSETAKLDTLMYEARTAIILLQERRTALISAAVTGQIDVRGAPEQAP